MTPLVCSLCRVRLCTPPPPDAIGGELNLWCQRCQERDGLTLGQKRILDLLTDGEGHRATEIAERVFLSNEYVRYTLLELVEQGHVRRRLGDKPPKGRAPYLYFLPVDRDERLEQAERERVGKLGEMEATRG